MIKTEQLDENAADALIGIKNFKRKGLKRPSISRKQYRSIEVFQSRLELETADKDQISRVDEFLSAKLLGAFRGGRGQKVKS